MILLQTDYQNSIYEGVMKLYLKRKKVDYLVIASDIENYNVYQAGVYMKYASKFMKEKDIFVNAVDVNSSDKLGCVEREGKIFIGYFNSAFWVFSGEKIKILEEEKINKKCFRVYEELLKVAVDIYEGKNKKAVEEKIINFSDIPDVLFVDKFGNLITKWNGDYLNGKEKIVVRDKNGINYEVKVADGYYNEGELIAYVGNFNLVEIALVGGNAYKKIGRDIRL